MVAVRDCAKFRVPAEERRRPVERNLVHFQAALARQDQRECVNHADLIQRAIPAPRTAVPPRPAPHLPAREMFDRRLQSRQDIRVARREVILRQQQSAHPQAPIVQIRLFQIRAGGHVGGAAGVVEIPGIARRQPQQPGRVDADAAIGDNLAVGQLKFRQVFASRVENPLRFRAVVRPTAGECSQDRQPHRHVLLATAAENPQPQRAIPRLGRANRVSERHPRIGGISKDRFADPDNPVAHLQDSVCR